jgi:hypothetical protein
MNKNIYDSISNNLNFKTEQMIKSIKSTLRRERKFTNMYYFMKDQIKQYKKIIILQNKMKDILNKSNITNNDITMLFLYNLKIDEMRENNFKKDRLNLDHMSNLLYKSKTLKQSKKYTVKNMGDKYDKSESFRKKYENKINKISKVESI